MAQNRLEDNPIIKQMASDIKALLKGQNELRDMLLHPENGIYKRIYALEMWQAEQEKRSNEMRKFWMKIILAVITTMLASGGIFGYVFHLIPK